MLSPDEVTKITRNMEAAIRSVIFISVLAIMTLWEYHDPRRTLTESKPHRWAINLGLTLFNSALLWLTFGAIVLSTAVFAGNHGWGLFNYVNLPVPVEMVFGILLFDFAIYVQHILSHALPVFWRLHRVHHTDLNFDVTTGLRFHPLEIFLSLIYKVCVVIVLGVHPVAAVVFEIILNAASLFNHGNVNIPIKMDRWLRFVLVTPDMHRIHHSSIVDETNSNFGFSISIWDRLCGTYLQTPVRSQLDMELGLQEYRQQTELEFFHLLLLPFKGELGNYFFQKK